MESYRKLCLRQQTKLRRLMMDPNQFEAAMGLFFDQHARLHAAEMAGSEPWSYEDEIFEDLSEIQARRIPPGCEHSIAWLVWHIARCEDITMNLLVAGEPQIMLRGDWPGKMRIEVCDTGNGMTPAERLEFSQCIDLPALRAYRMAVGRQTRAIAAGLGPDDLKRKVDPARMQQVWDQGALVEAARGIGDYWASRDVAGLLLMPATRHPLTHLNEAQNVKRKR